MERLICLAALIIGYGFGLIQVAHIYSKAHNVNIHERGSGNAGTTNMFRVMGIKAGVVTLVGDCAKAVAAIFFTRIIFILICGFQIDYTALLLYTGLGCVLGHDFPFYFKFKGGKGMATTAALICCLGSWQLIVIGVIIFFSIVFLTRFVSLGSMVTVVCEACLFIIFSECGLINITAAYKADCYILFIIIALLLVFQHRKNIVRLVTKSETKFHFRTSKQIKQDEAMHVEENAKAKIEKLNERVERKAEKTSRVVEKTQDKAETKVEKVQVKAELKAEKTQLKAEHKVEKKQQRLDKKIEKTQIKTEKIEDKAQEKSEKLKC